MKRAAYPATKTSEAARSVTGMRPFIGSTPIHSSKRKSDKIHDAVRNTISKPARNASHARSIAGCSANNEAVASTAAMRSGARMGSSSSGRSSSRMRRNGGKDGARYRQTQRAQPQDQRQPADHSLDRDIVENSEDGDKNHL